MGEEGDVSVAADEEVEAEEAEAEEEGTFGGPSVLLTLRTELEREECVKALLRALAAVAPSTATSGRGLHSSTFRLNVSAFCGIGGALNNCVGGV
jgi:hypothetical protein